MAEKAKPAAGNGGSREFRASDWKTLEKNTFKGFLTIVLPSGLRIKECGLHERNVPILDFASDEARARFQTLAIAAVDALFGGPR
jgi:hypothetical protein